MEQPDDARGANGDNGGENSEPDDKHEYTNADAWSDVFTNKDCLVFAEKAVANVTAVIDERLKERNAIERGKLNQWSRGNWRWFVLAVAAMGFLTLSAWFSLLPTEVIAALAEAVISSLFVVTKQLPLPAASSWANPIRG